MPLGSSWRTSVRTEAMVRGSAEVMAVRYWTTASCASLSRCSGRARSAERIVETHSALGKYRAASEVATIVLDVAQRLVGDVHRQWGIVGAEQKAQHSQRHPERQFVSPPGCRGRLRSFIKYSMNVRSGSLSMVARRLITGL